MVTENKRQEAKQLRTGTGDSTTTIIIRHNVESSSSGSVEEEGNTSRMSAREVHPKQETEETEQEVVQSPTSPQATEVSGLQLWFQKFQDLRRICGEFVNDKRVQTTIVWLIAINAAMMGIGTSKKIKNNDTANDAFEAIDLAFLVIFTVELGMQFVYHGWRILVDGWLLFDTIIIVTSWSFSEIQIIRAFRIFRALRLITRIKVMKNLILALFGVIPRMLAIGVLLFLVSYIFAVMFTQLFKDLHEDGYTEVDYFGQLDKTFFTLFQIMTLDAWADIAREVMLVYPWAWLPFIVFVIVTGFVVVNLMIAVICDSIAALHDDEKAKLHGMYNDLSDRNSEEEMHPALAGDIQEQLDSLEDQVDDLSRMQEETIMALETLTQCLQIQRTEKEEASP